MINYLTEESVLLEELRKGNRKAFAELVEINSEGVYRVALRMLNNEQDAEDILQETFIKAFKSLPEFEGRSKLSTWLYRIAVNEALMLIRKRKVNTVSIDEEMETEDGDMVPRQVIDWCCMPEAEMLNGESQSAISKAVAHLSPANRAVFILRDLSGLSVRETAETLDISESAVKTRLLRARLDLREQLSDFYSGRMAAIERA